jgi:hypothetical protein
VFTVTTMMMAGDYPSSDFEIVDDDRVRRVLHLPTGMLVETSRLRADPIAVPVTYTVKHADAVARSGAITQAALRHLRVWLMRNSGKRAIRAPM